MNEPDTEVIAQALYDRSLAAVEVPLQELRSMLARAEPGHPTIDEPERYRWFLLRGFPVHIVGTLRNLNREGTRDDRWRRDRIVELLLNAGVPAWPAFFTADGILVDGYHRIAAHETLRDRFMDVVVAVQRRAEAHDTWNTFWNDAFPGTL